MPALADSPARIVQQALILLGLGDDADAVPFAGTWPVYCEKLPPQAPDRVVSVVNTLGKDDGRDQHSGEWEIHYGFHVTVRGRTGEEGFRRCEAIRAGLAEDATGLTVTFGTTTYLVNAVTNLGQVFRAGVEPGSDRIRYTLTGDLSVVTVPTPTGFDVVSIADDGNGNPLMTTAAPHGLVGGEFIVVSGNSEPTYDKQWGAVETPNTPTTVLIGTPGDPPQPTGTGGTWALVPPDLPHTILTATDNGTGAVLFTTAAAHGLNLDDLVTVSGNSNPAYDGGPFQVDGIPSPTSFETGSLIYDVDGSGGTWSPA